jgi:hypothetical protein
MEDHLSKLTLGKAYGDIGIYDGKAHIGDTYHFNVPKNEDSQTPLLQSLAFPEALTRYNSIELSHPQTFEWLFADVPLQDSVSLPAWLDHGTGIYLLEGKPGAGKSTLMKFIANHPFVRDRFVSRSIRTNLNVLKHFFWLAGSDLQKSFRGLLADFAYQAASLWPNQAEAIVSQQRAKRKRLDDWTTIDLEHFVINVLANAGEDTLLLLDGMDEFDPAERPIKLVTFLNKLTMYPNIKLCVSSRPLTWVQQGFSSLSKVMLHELTRSDIDRFATEVLREEFKLAGYKDDSELAEILDIIREKAEGVFLWVKYALRSLAEGLDEFDDATNLKMRLEALPSGMEELYMHTWKRYENYNARHRDEAAIFFSCARRFPLRLFDIAVMTDTELYKHYTDKRVRASADMVRQAMARTRRKLMIRTAGLLTCQIEHNGNNIPSISFYQVGPAETKEENTLLRDSFYFVNVSYLHRTVQDFLFATTYGQSITQLSIEQQQDLDNRWCFSVVASIRQGFAERNQPAEVHWLCERLSYLENVEHHTVQAGSMEIIDNALRTSVSAMQGISHSTSWYYDLLKLEAIKQGYPAADQTINPDFGGLLLAKGAFDSLKNLLLIKRPSTTYLTYLLFCALAGMEDYTQEALQFVRNLGSTQLGTSKSYLPFIQWLLDQGADAGAKVNVRQQFMQLILRL